MAADRDGTGLPLAGLPLAGLPVVGLIEPLAAVLEADGRALVEAPPGAGKSTVLPLQVGASATPDRRLILIQPRRLAASAVAQRLARQLGEPVGGRVGLRTRFDRLVSSRTAIEVVTEGIFLRTIQRDPELSGIGWVLFDEFHERSWQADLGLAFALESQRDWRSEPLRLVVMSATLPGAELQRWFAAPLLRAEGRCYPVAIEYAPPGRVEWTAHTAAQVRAALATGARKVLVFLPGLGAMQRVARQLGALEAAALHLLHSSVPRERQEAALEAPPPGEQCVVLATNIAETSLTIEGVDVVIDSGRVRRPSFDPGRGMDRLEEGWVSLASAEQRAGRAGRLGPGRCIRLWDSERQRRLQRYDVPEVRVVDPSPVALELAVWGGEPALLDSPDPLRWEDARRSLQLLDALDSAGRVTATGRQLAQLGLHPRLGRLVLEGRSRGCAWLACAIAALVSEGDFLPREAGPDVGLRLEALRRGDPGAGDRAAFTRVRRLIEQLAGRATGPNAGEAANLADAGALLAQAWPDRLARRRDGDAPRFLTVAGFEVIVPAHDPLAHQEWIIALEHDGAREGAQLQLAATVSPTTVAECSGARATVIEQCGWDDARNQIVAQRERRLGAVLLDRMPGRIEAAAAVAIWRQQIEINGLAWLGWGERGNQWLARLRWIARRMPAANWAARFEDETLMAELDEWLLPWLAECRRLDDLRRLDIQGLLRARLSYAEAQQLEALAPTQWQLPSGRSHAIDYLAGQPRLAARLTEFYGLDVHPLVAGEPLLLELLSPGGRPLQITGDLPGFWRAAYADVRKEMKGRYPKHFWPEQPWCAPATATTKRHMPAGSH